jgi:uncharacterized protein YvpB
MSYAIAGSLGYLTKYRYYVNTGVMAEYGTDSTAVISGSFTTKSNVTLLGVPLYSQPLGTFICNLVATRMVLAYKGIYVSNSQVQNSLGTGSNPNVDYVDGYGVHWGPVNTYLHSKGVSSEIKQGWNLTALLNEVAQGHPVILWWWNRYGSQYTFNLGGATAYNEMHSEVVVGFVGEPSNPSSIITNDPWRGRLYYTPSTFNATWSYIGKTAIVVR